MGRDETTLFIHGNTPHYAPRLCGPDSNSAEFHYGHLAGHLRYEVFLLQKTFQEVEDERSSGSFRYPKNNNPRIISRRIVLNIREI
jgi:hypothetical protein